MDKEQLERGLSEMLTRASGVELSPLPGTELSDALGEYLLSWAEGSPWLSRASYAAAQKIILEGAADHFKGITQIALGYSMLGLRIAPVAPVPQTDFTRKLFEGE